MSHTVDESDLARKEGLAEAPDPITDQSVRSMSAIGPALVQQGLETEAEMEERTQGVREAAAGDDRFEMYDTTVSGAGRA